MLCFRPMPAVFVIGQRWMSTTQPELGIGLVVGASGNQVQVHFPAGGETLTYAAANAPLRRVEFEVGDSVTGQEGDSFVVKEVRVEDGLLTYCGGGNELHESRLSDALPVDKPEARLLGLDFEDASTFRLRRTTLLHRFKARARAVSGLCGGRVSLLPHQLFIAHEVASRQAPRVLLADEVGLGKTIEAGLILHRLHHAERAERILILVPEPLIHQWFVEMLRRFQLSFAIYDEERAASIESADPDLNPFLDDQLVLLSIPWLESHPRRIAQAAEAGWDVMVVDEAHHLEWTPDEVSPAYEAVETIARSSSGLLLLTATPEQLGREGHFARLRLLDPDRFDRLERFEEEMRHYGEISRLADRIGSGTAITDQDRSQLSRLIGSEPIPEDREEILEALLDEHGTGRVVFRNRREVLSGFPRRELHLHPLSDAPGAKIRWLSQNLQDHPEEKFLLICHTPAQVAEIDEGLRREINVDLAVFHENLSLVQRDRNAAWFAEPDGGARILLCSEIGSEGRNFQFAHHLVLFDLPTNPGLLEQRIGRLDRIGQTSTIHIHVPFHTGTREELLALWYHEGLNAFEHTLHGGELVYQHFHRELEELGEDDWEEAWPDLRERTIAFRTRLKRALEEGRDHLLELSSLHREVGEGLAREIETLDEDPALEEYVLKLFDHFGVTVEDLGRRQYLLKPEHLFSAETFAGLPAAGLAITFDRATALAREDLVFLTWDHPMVASAMEMLIASPQGNAGFLELRGTGEKGMLLDLTFLLEPVAPARLHLDRFLPPVPVRVIVNHEGRDCTPDYPAGSLQRASEGQVDWLRQHAQVLKDLIPRLIKKGRRFANPTAREARTRAAAAMDAALGGELERLERLRKLGHAVRPSEIQGTKAEREALAQAIEESRLRLDSLRLIRLRP